MSVVRSKDAIIDGPDYRLRRVAHNKTILTQTLGVNCSDIDRYVTAGVGSVHGVLTPILVFMPWCLLLVMLLWWCAHTGQCAWASSTF